MFEINLLFTQVCNCTIEPLFSVALTWMRQETTHKFLPHVSLPQKWKTRLKISSHNHQQISPPQIMKTNGSFFFKYDSWKYLMIVDAIHDLYRKTKGQFWILINQDLWVNITAPPPCSTSIISDLWFIPPASESMAWHNSCQNWWHQSLVEVAGIAAKLVAKLAPVWQG